MMILPRFHAFDAMPLSPFALRRCRHIFALMTLILPVITDFAYATTPAPCHYFAFRHAFATPLPPLAISAITPAAFFRLRHSPLIFAADTILPPPPPIC
jgi:hypothetical protein